MNKSKMLALILCLSMLLTIIMITSNSIKINGNGQYLLTDNAENTQLETAGMNSRGSVPDALNETAKIKPDNSILVGDGGFTPGRDPATKDSNNSFGTKSEDCEGQLSVSTQEKEQVTVTTDLYYRTILAGFPVTDTATVTSESGPVPTGTVTFEYSYEGGPWHEYDSNTLYVDGRTETHYLYTFGGHFEFRAIYSGDDNYLSATSPEGSEPLDAIKNPSFTDLVLNGGPRIALGESVSLSAGVPPTGRFPPTDGNVTFQLSYEGGLFKTFDTQALENASVEYTPSAAGHYEFQAIYSGGRDYLGSMSPVGYAPLDVYAVSSDTTTCLGAKIIFLGGSVTDNVTVTGLCDGSPFPTGTVEFQVSFNGGSWMTYDTGVVLANGSATSTWYMPHIAGDYNFRAIYSGDSNYSGSCSLSRSESLHVGKAQSTTTTDLGIIFP
jgi:hypothetical protein